MTARSAQARAKYSKPEGVFSKIGATLLGILLIWLIYSGLVMRFAWVPTTKDAVFPFLVGIVEFALISALGPDTLGLWFIILGGLYGAMSWISQATMAHARQDAENALFFSNSPPSSPSLSLCPFSFLPPACSSVSVLVGF